MCNTDCGTCEHCQATDTWLTPRQPVFLPPLTPEQPEDAHGPALTRDGFTGALRALGRDGGEGRG